MSKTVRYCIYIVIIAFCIIAIIVGINAQFFVEKESNVTPDLNIVNMTNINEEDNINNRFMQLFDNRLPQFKEYSNLVKSDLNKNYVYIYSENAQLPNGPYVRKVDGKYNIVAYLPVFNMNSEVANKFNNITMNYFIKIMNDLILNENTINSDLTISFAANINNNILSVAIIAKLNENTKPQKIMIQGYNYDLLNNREVSINEVLKNKGIDNSEVNSKIENVVKRADNSKYSRNLQSGIYSIDKITNFIIGKNGEVYIIYAYGNQNNVYTSEMDIVQI